MRDIFVIILISSVVYSKAATLNSPSNEGIQNRGQNVTRSWSVWNLFSWSTLKPSFGNVARWRLSPVNNFLNPFRWINDRLSDLSLYMAAQNLARLLSVPLPNDTTNPTILAHWNATTKKYLNNVRNMDVDDCMALLLCRVVGNSTKFGALERQLTKFFRANDFSSVDEASAGWWFAKAYKVGKKAFSAKDVSRGCLEQYADCHRNVIGLISVVRKH